NPLIQLKRSLELQVPIESWTSPPLIWGKNEFLDFVGFGEVDSRNLIEELSYYTLFPRLTVSGGWKALIDELLSLIPQEKKLTRPHVTKMDMGAEKITSLTVNGELVINTEKVIFTLSPNTLPRLLPPQTISGKTAQRLSKTEPFTVLSLDIAIPQKLSP